MLCFFRNLKIKTKLIIIFFSIVFLISFFSFAALQISFTIYNELLYNKSTEALKLSTIIVENELKNVENLTYKIATDPQIQEYLEIIKKQYPSYDKSRAINYLKEELLRYALEEIYITSINLIDTYGNEYIAGIDCSSISSERKSEIEKDAKDEEGSNLLIEPYKTNDYIIFAREIRQIANLKLETLGILILRINMKEIIHKYLKIISKYNVQLAIISGNSVVFSTDNQLKFSRIYSELKEKEGYIVISLEGEKYFIVYTSSSYTGWKYINVIIYENIFKQINILKCTVILIYLIIYFIAVFIGIRFTFNITKPIEGLTLKLKQVESGNFEIEDFEYGKQYSEDEIGTFYKDFNIMIRKIRTLINENYIKKLKIKDTEYRMLQAQINPHFLYNTLDSINWLAKLSKQPKIAVMVKSLGSLLRSSISNKEYIITVTDEIKLLGDYIDIQKIRYGDRLDFNIKADEALMQNTIPKLIIQPVVENSINYGLEKITGVCRIWVKFLSKQRFMEIQICDNGLGMSREFIEMLKTGKVEPSGSGIGLKNIDERIKLIYGLEYGIDIDSEIGKGTIVTILVPLRNRAETGTTI